MISKASLKDLLIGISIIHGRFFVLRNLFNTLVEVTGFTTDTVGENIATVKVSYTSGSVTETAEYKITVTLAVTKIEVTGVETAYVYNPGALDTALDTAFTYEITATYSDGTTDSLDASKCTIAVNSTNDGIIASYTSAANGELTDEYTSDEIKTAISSFTVESGYALGDSDCSASWIASTDIKIPVGKTIVATFKNYGSGNNNYNNFLLEFTIPGGSGITARADNYGWNYASEGTAGEDIDYAEATTSTTVTDWETWLAVIKNGADIICIAENNGTTLDITCTSTTEGLTDWIQKYSVPFKTDLAKSAGVNFHFNIDGAYLVFD